MPSFTDEAVVLKVIETGEANCILHLLTHNRGRRNVFAQNARKSRKRFSGALMPFAHLQIVSSVRRDQDLDRLQQAELIDAHAELHGSLASIYLASHYCELLDLLLVEGEQYPEVFELVLFFLGRLKQAKASIKHRIFFELRMLDLLGNRPDLSFCGDCGQELSGESYFDPDRQLMIARAGTAYPARLIPISDATRYAMQRILDGPLHGLGTIRLSREMLHQIEAVSRSLLQSQVPRALRTLELLEDELVS